MTFELEFTDDADEDLLRLKKDKSKEPQLKAVLKCLGYMQTNLRHPLEYFGIMIKKEEE